jgi:thymidylate kinase
MKWLIIVRGVTGVGKSTTVDKLVQRLGIKAATSLNMDTIEKDQIDRYIEVSMNFQYVIAHIYSGSQNTYDPVAWLSRFRENDYHVISFVLDIGFEAGKKRCLQRDRNRTEAEYKRLWERFQKPPFSVFARKANVKEININAELNLDAISSQICAAIAQYSREV